MTKYRLSTPQNNIVKKPDNSSVLSLVQQFYCWVDMRLALISKPEKSREFTAVRLAYLLHRRLTPPRTQLRAMLVILLLRIEQ
jgi:hypothetical protein